MYDRPTKRRARRETVINQAGALAEYFFVLHFRETFSRLSCRTLLRSTRRPPPSQKKLSNSRGERALRKSKQMSFQTCFGEAEPELRQISIIALCTIAIYNAINIYFRPTEAADCFNGTAEKSLALHGVLSNSQQSVVIDNGFDGDELNLISSSARLYALAASGNESFPSRRALRRT
jgi:hypothetical protein